MKIVCNCGNEMEFIIDNEDIAEETIEELGDYVRKDYKKFNFWSEHDEAGIGCENCGKAIWYFT